MRVDVDLSVLDYCREDCGDPSLHLAHGPRAGSVTVHRPTETVFVGPVVAYRCGDCGSETVAAAGRRRPRCSYCRALQLNATGFAPGAAMCRGGTVDVVRVSTNPARRRVTVKAPCPTCSRNIEIMQSGVTRPHRPIETDAVVDPVLTDVVFRTIGRHVPVPFADIYESAVNAYSTRLSERSTQRALALLLTSRQVAAIGDATWAPSRQRTAAVPGYYIRYDSPKLWSRDGLRDLMSVVAQADDERAVFLASEGVRRSRERDEAPYREVQRLAS